jgi:hypothetical protein
MIIKSVPGYTSDKVALREYTGNTWPQSSIVDYLLYTPASTRGPVVDLPVVSGVSRS